MTPEEIRNMTFEKGVRGYRCEDVDDFVAQLSGEMAGLTAQRTDLENKLRILAQKVEEYRGQEETLKTALINAQRMGETVVYEAHQRADMILRDAESQADLLRRQAEREYGDQRMALENLSGEVQRFKEDMLNYYSKQIEGIVALGAVTDTAEGLLQRFPAREAPEDDTLPTADEEIPVAEPAAEETPAAPYTEDGTVLYDPYAAAPQEEETAEPAETEEL